MGRVLTLREERRRIGRLRRAELLFSEWSLLCGNPAVSTGNVVIEFVDCSSADANRYAQDLESALLSVDPSIEVKRRRTNEESQDLVSSLVLLFGTPLATYLARSVYTWLARNSGAKIRISTPTGEVIAENLDSKDTARIAEAFAVAQKAK